MSNNLEKLETESYESTVFIPTWDNRPKEQPPVLKLNDESILSFQNMTCIIAPPAAGKSNICEGVVSSVINSEVDNLGFTTTAKSILFIDMERTQSDVWKSFYRVMKRAKVEEGTNIDNVLIVSFRELSTAQERRDKIEDILKEKHYEILLFDGIGDLVSDTNSLEQAIGCKNWVRMITSKYDTSILTTLHPNKNSNTPRGHIGSEILRESENVFIIDVDNKTGIRTITTDFAHGKARNGKHATGCFEWSDEHMMFISSEVVIREKIIKLTPIERLEHEELLTLCLATNKTMKNATETLSEITNYLKTTVSYVKVDNSNIKKFLRYLEDNNYLVSSKKENDKRTTYYQYNESMR
jgi:hypothetical protein